MEQAEFEKMLMVVKFDTLCEGCRGSGEYAYVGGICHSCHGSGGEPTELGEKILRFVKHHYRYLRPDWDD